MMHRPNVIPSRVHFDRSQTCDINWNNIMLGAPKGNSKSSDHINTEEHNIQHSI